MAMWDDVLPQEDLDMFAKSKFGSKGDYGKQPAILFVDLT